MISLFIALIINWASGDRYIVSYPLLDSIRGMAYKPVDTFIVLNQDTIFSVLSGYIPLENMSPIQRIKNVYQKLLPGVKILVRREVKVNVIGALYKQGSYYLYENTTVGELIAKAGGVRPGANWKKIRIIYPDGRRKIINCEKKSCSKYNLKELGIVSNTLIIIPYKINITIKDIATFIGVVIILWNFYNDNFRR